MCDELRFAQFWGLKFFIFDCIHLAKYWASFCFLFGKNHDWILFFSASFCPSCLLSYRYHFIFARCFPCWLGEQYWKSDVCVVLLFLQLYCMVNCSCFMHLKCSPFLWIWCEFPWFVLMYEKLGPWWHNRLFEWTQRLDPWLGFFTFLALDILIKHWGFFCWLICCLMGFLSRVLKYFMLVC